MIVSPLEAPCISWTFGSRLPAISFVAFVVLYGDDGRYKFTAKLLTVLFDTIIKHYERSLLEEKNTSLLTFKLKCVIINTTYFNLQRKARRGFWFYINLLTVFKKVSAFSRIAVSPLLSVLLIFRHSCVSHRHIENTLWISTNGSYVNPSRYHFWFWRHNGKLICPL